MSVIALSANTSWYLYNFRKNTILSLVACGYKVITIAPKDEYSDNLIELGRQFIDIDIDKGGTNPIKDLRTLFDFYRIFKVNKVDVVLNFTPKNNIYSTLAAHVNSVRAINNIAGLGILFINESLPSKIARYLYKISQSKAAKIFFQNEDDKTLFLNNNFLID